MYILDWDEFSEGDIYFVEIVYWVPNPRGYFQYLARVTEETPGEACFVWLPVDIVKFFLDLLSDGVDAIIFHKDILRAHQVWATGVFGPKMTIVDRLVQEIFEVNDISSQKLRKWGTFDNLAVELNS